MSYNVYGVGNAIVDVQARVSDDLLLQIDFAKGVMTLVDETTQQKVLSQLKGHSLNRCAGGSAANTILGIAQFGGTAAYAGKVADDETGRFFLQDMRELGVVIEVPASAGGQTATCVVLITSDAQRTMLTNLAVSSTLAPEDIDEEEIRKSDYVYIEGYLFAGQTTKAAALKAIDLAKQHNVKVSLTVSDPFIVDLCRSEFWDLIEGPVDLLFCNLDEARMLTKQHDPIDCAKQIHDHAATVALTLGGDGSMIMEGNRVIPVEAVPVDALDTTGAGDMFAAGLLYGITNGLSWKQAGHLASHAASRIVGQLGARLAQPLSPEEMQQIIDR